MVLSRKVRKRTNSSVARASDVVLPPGPLVAASSGAVGTRVTSAMALVHYNGAPEARIPEGPWGRRDHGSHLYPDPVISPDPVIPP